MKRQVLFFLLITTSYVCGMEPGSKENSAFVGDAIQRMYDNLLFLRPEMGVNARRSLESTIAHVRQSRMTKEESICEVWKIEHLHAVVVAHLLQENREREESFDAPSPKRKRID